jgi:hypothetical protein
LFSDFRRNTSGSAALKPARREPGAIFGRALPWRFQSARGSAGAAPRSRDRNPSAARGAKKNEQRSSRARRQQLTRSGWATPAVYMKREEALVAISLSTMEYVAALILKITSQEGFNCGPSKFNLVNLFFGY